MEKVCAREGCGVVFKGCPSAIKKRKYCSHACNAMANFGIKGIDKMPKEARSTPVGEFRDTIVNGPVPEIKLAELSPLLIKIRKAIKSVGKCVKYGEGGEPIGEYDWDGNLRSY